MSIYTRIGQFVKSVFGIKDFSLFKKNVKKRVGRIIYHKKYTAVDVVTLMREMGMKPGSLVCIHASMKEFYNYDGTAKELIESIIDALGPTGTLMMPAFPKYSLVNSPGYVFDSANDPTGAGYLAEEFRKFPGVRRSINVQHSVCVYGQYADLLTRGHENCHDCWGEGSPWLLFCHLGGIVFNLGMPRSYIGTFHHCVESELQYDYSYWALFFTKQVKYRYYSSEHEIKEYTSFVSDLERRTRESKVTRHFNKNDWSIKKISNLEIKAFYTKHCYPKMLALGKKGICVYYIPNPKPFFKCR